MLSYKNYLKETSNLAPYKYLLTPVIPFGDNKEPDYVKRGVKLVYGLIHYSNR